MELKWDGLIALLIIIFIGLLVYSKMKNKTLRETFGEIKELFVPTEGAVAS